MRFDYIYLEHIIINAIIIRYLVSIRQKPKKKQNSSTVTIIIIYNIFITQLLFRQIHIQKKRESKKKIEQWLVKDNIYDYEMRMIK